MKFIKIVSSVFLFVALQQAQAATFNFGSPNGNNSGGNPNTFTFTNAGVTASVSGYSWNPDDNAGIYKTLVQQFNAGLGVCNAAEQPGCSFNQHAIDNRGQKEFMVIKFDQMVDFNSLTLTQFSNQDGYLDYEYWTTNLKASDSLVDLSPINNGGGTTDLGFAIGVSTHVASRGFGVHTLNLTGQQGNTIIVAGTVFGAFGGNDNFKLSGAAVTPAVVPVPAAVWLMLSGLAGLVGFSKRQKKS